MKMLTVLITIILTSGIVTGQTLHKGNLVGMHVVEVDLKPNVTMEQYMDFYSNEVLPEFNKHFKGWKGFLAKGIRGENEDKYGIIWVIDTEAARDRYFNDEGEMNETGNAIMEKLQPVTNELEKYGTSSSKYTDWLVQ